jgi:tripartite-type tricarboxylate transporter receptor subunit TctC
MGKQSVLAAAFAGSIWFAGASSAQQYPDHHITMVVPFTAASPADTISRILAPGLTRALGQQVIVENVSGAGGTNGIRRAAKSPPDGYTIAVVSTGTHAGAVALYPELGYDPIDSFESVGLIGSTPIAIVARRDFPPNTLQELIEYLHSNARTVTLAHSGIGSVSHIFCAYFQSLIGVRTLSVPFRGPAEFTQAMLAGQVDYGCNQAPVAMEYAKTGALKLYVISSERRSPLMPLVPTAAESGLPSFTLGTWSALQVPKGTSAPIVARLNMALSAALEESETRERFAALGIEVAPLDKRTPAALTSFIKSEIIRWKPLLETELAAQRH